MALAKKAKTAKKKAAAKKKTAPAKSAAKSAARGMSTDEFADVLFDTWNALYATNDEVGFDAWRDDKISDTVSDLSGDPALEHYQDTRFVVTARELYRPGVTVPAFNSTRYKAYRSDDKTWDELADYMRRSQRRSVTP